jgi:proteasome lid subunit RPN8/RPN11
MLTNAQRTAAMKHAEDDYPNESCGLIVGGRYKRVPNSHKKPDTDFKMDGDYWLKWGTPTAVVHSHPNGPRWPSAADMQSQVETAVPWYIVYVTEDGAVDIASWGDSLPIPQLIGRQFMHGTSDCYSLIRDYYRVERGVTIPEYPRDDEWWSDGKDLYSKGFKKAGFKQVPIESMQAGDVLLAKVRSPVLNHGGVYIGDDLLLHHLPNRLSRREPVGPWLKYVELCVRYTGKGGKDAT